MQIQLWSRVFLTRFLTETPRDGAGGQGFREPVKTINAGEMGRIGCVGTQGLWPCVLITRRSQVQILPPLPTSSQVRGPFPLGEGLLRVWPVTRSVTRLLTSDVSVVPLRLRRNAVLRFVRHAATDRDT